jgi:hypothetical protein
VQLSGVEDGLRLPVEREQCEVHARRGRGHGRGHRRGHGRWNDQPCLEQSGFLRLHWLLYQDHHAILEMRLEKLRSHSSALITLCRAVHERRTGPAIEYRVRRRSAWTE